jgi:hypothetical protein
VWGSTEQRAEPRAPGMQPVTSSYVTALGACGPVVIKVECHPVGLTTLGRVCPRKAAAFQKSGNHGRRFVILSCLMPFKMGLEQDGSGSLCPRTQGSPSGCTPSKSWLPPGRRKEGVLKYAFNPYNPK